MHKSLENLRVFCGNGNRALAQAIFEEARRMLPAPVSPARLDALRAHCAPMAQGYVLSCQARATSRELKVSFDER